MIDSLNTFLSEIEYLKESEQLLQSIYLEIGPYRDREVTPELWNRVRNHFKFNDDE
jgi:hypothetical protein